MSLFDLIVKKTEDAINNKIGELSKKLETMSAEPGEKKKAPAKRKKAPTKRKKPAQNPIFLLKV